MKHVAADVHDPFAGPALAAYVPATAAQSEIWLAAAMGPEVSIAYNEGLVLSLRGTLDVDALRRSLQALVDRHESLRASFSADGRSMLIHESIAVDLPVRDLASVEELARAEAGLTGAPLDLEDGPLFRFELCRLAGDDHRLLAVAHHAICDGRSWGQMVFELAELYSAAVENRAPALEPAPSYVEYARREREFLASAEAEAHMGYWLGQLRDAPSPASLPPDRSYPPRRSYAAARHDVRLSEALTASLRQAGAAHNASLAMSLLAAFTAQLHRLTGSTDAVIGLAASGQVLHGLPSLVGHCANFMPLRLRPQPQQGLADLLGEVRGVVLDALEHQGLTFGSLLPRLGMQRDPQRPPLIAVAFNLDAADAPVRFAGLDFGSTRIHRQAENFELFLNVVDEGSTLRLECSYNRDLFDAASIAQRLQEYECVLRALAEDPAQVLCALPLAGEGAAVEETAIPDRSLHALIAEQAARTPHAIAVECGAAALTYAALVARADAIAGALQARGAGPGARVAVCLRRSEQLPAGLLGVLKCGAAYVPLDPELPLQRLRYMIEDAGAALVLCEAATRAAVSGADPLLLEEIPATGAAVNVEVEPLAAAYAIYTSGSTGQPKGVLAHHRGVINCLEGTRKWIPIGPDDALLAIATCAFDASVLEYFLPLLNGARLVIAPSDAIGDGRLLAELIERHGITRIFTAPSAWKLLLSADWPGKQDLIGISWAEPLTRDLARELLPRLGQLWNLYGPTETTVWMLGSRITDIDAPITIGKPIPNTQALILDAQGRPVPLGVVGELHIGGAGVALGYLERPELTAERFVDSPHGRVYRTGDLARWTAEGEVLCLGRADHQVKLRGFRIELGEIEAALKSCEGVADCACGLRDRTPGDARLVAWVQPQPGFEPSASELRGVLRERLPSYMVPQHFPLVEALPRLPNGKLDRSRLPDPFGLMPAVEPVRTAPRSEAERRVASIWRELLGHDEIGLDDRFLDRGGHSLLAVQAGERLRDAFGVRLPLRIVLMGTLAQVALACVQAQEAAPQGTSGSPLLALAAQ